MRPRSNVSRIGSSTSPTPPSAIERSITHTPSAPVASGATKTSPAGRLPNAPGRSSTPSSSFHSRPVTSNVQSVPPGVVTRTRARAREPLAQARGQLAHRAVVGRHLVLEDRVVHAPAEGDARARLAGRACRAACGSPRTRRRGCARTRSRARRSRPATPRAARTSRAAAARASGTTTHAAEAAPAAERGVAEARADVGERLVDERLEALAGLDRQAAHGVRGVDGDAHGAGISSGSASRPSARRTARPSASSESTTSRS